MDLSSLIHVSWLDYPNISEIGVLLNIDEELYELFYWVTKDLRWRLSVQVEGDGYEIEFHLSK